MSIQRSDAEGSKNPQNGQSEDSTSSPKNQITAAIARLNTALEALDQAVDLTIEKKTKFSSPEEEVQNMAGDRAKLAQHLDHSEARAKRLYDTNKEVSRRIVGAMETIRGVLDTQSR